MSWGLCATFHNFLFLCIWAQSEKNLLLPPSWGLRKPVARAAPRRQAEICHAVCPLLDAALSSGIFQIHRQLKPAPRILQGVSGRDRGEPVAGSLQRNLPVSPSHREKVVSCGASPDLEYIRSFHLGDGERESQVLHNRRCASFGVLQLKTVEGWPRFSGHTSVWRTGQALGLAFPAYAQLLGQQCFSLALGSYCLVFQSWLPLR